MNASVRLVRACVCVHALINKDDSKGRRQLILKNRMKRVPVFVNVCVYNNRMSVKA